VDLSQGDEFIRTMRRRLTLLGRDPPRDTNAAVSISRAMHCRSDVQRSKGYDVVVVGLEDVEALSRARSQRSMRTMNI
jgi:hypothetical protein